ncbi:dipeptidyl aminopeptidase [Rhodanobacter thiooxydans]|uniref:Dipeptidyl aminopeptidase n=2 Tax=Rhodanobacter thiooxydans TaxID=416169 RepID=A0A154QI34_9GAMM|nr:dipeptidyl aminopeptidase/acylaminoacyl-peptidase-like protein [Rhodanobacter thiooxydans LCS2]KZC23843.1 dipeptidyl aminopeptidase [Rhodanobacter thiooxydans]
MTGFSRFPLVGRREVMSMSKCFVRPLFVAGGLLATLVSVCHAEAVSPRRLLEVVDIAGPTMSPDGRSVAFRVERASVARNTYDTVWYVQGLGDPWPRRVADGGVPLRDSAGGSSPPKVLWSPDNRRIYYRALVDGKIDVWRAAADGSGAVPLTHDAADIRDFVLDEDGRVLRYSVGATREEVQSAERAEYDKGIYIDASVPIGQGLFRSGYVDGRLETQRFSKVWFDRLPLLADVPDRWMEIDLTKGTRQALADSNAASAPSSAPSKAGVDGDPWQSVSEPHDGRVAWLTRIGDGRGQQQRPDVLLSALQRAHANRAVRCISALCTGKAISAIQWRPDHDEVLFTVTDFHQGLAQSILRWNVGTGNVREVVAAGGLVNGGRDPASNCGASADVLVCVTAKADRPPQLESVDLESGKRHVLFNPNEALARDMVDAAPARLLQWQDKQGRWFSGQFYSALRSGGEPMPLFITYYSCPGFVRGGVGDEWPLASLAQAGISALCINRLPGYTMDAVARYGEGLAAAESAVDRLAKEGEIDRARVGMGGLSFGAEVAMWTVAHSNLLAAASAANPVVSPSYYLIGSIKGEAFLKGLRERWGLGSPSETPERWKALSPAFQLHRIHAPILFQHSEQEYMYALDYEIPLIREHRADLYVFPNEPHQKFQPRHKLAVYNRNLDWFRFWLQGHEDPDPAKAAQYARWRLMRSSLRKERAAH